MCLASQEDTLYVGVIGGFGCQMIVVVVVGQGKYRIARQRSHGLNPTFARPDLRLEGY